MDIYVVTRRIVSPCMLECCRMVVTIYQRVTKLFRPTWQHHHLMIASTIVLIIQSILGLTPGAGQYGRPHPRLDASLLECTLRSLPWPNSGRDFPTPLMRSSADDLIARA